MRSTSLVLALLAAACGEPTAPRDRLVVALSQQALYLRNRGPDPIHFGVMPAPVTAFRGPLCTDSPACINLLPGADTTIDVSGFSDGWMLQVYLEWWPMVLDRAGGAHGGTIRSEVLTICPTCAQ